MQLLRWNAGYILDLSCVTLSNGTLFCENYAKLYFDVKHLEKGLIRGVCEILKPVFLKKCPFIKKGPFLANIERCPKFLEYAQGMVVSL